jgi:hypothetical protein
MTMPGLKRLCDFFAVDRTLKKTKDDVVDTLLDFLGAPNKNKVSGRAKASKKGKKKTKKSSADDDDEEDEDDEEENEDDDGYDDVDDDMILEDENGKPNGGTLPHNDQLRKWVRAYVRCFHVSKLTVNHALEIGSEKFGIDLTPKKADLKKILIDEL